MLIHSATLRIVHGLNALAVLGLVSSGWAIYNAAPFYTITFPANISLGGYLTEALRWHFLLAWLFLITTLLFVGLRLFSTKFKTGPQLFPISGRTILNDIRQAVIFKLSHTPGQYNHLQRVIYSTLIGVFMLLILSGLGLWKPVQLQDFNSLVGGYEIMRRVHFWSMTVVTVFTVVHLIMIILVPKTLLSMMFGLRTLPGSSTSDKTGETNDHQQ